MPYWTAQYFGYALREPLVLGVPIGLVFACFHARRRARACRSRSSSAMVAVFAVGPMFGLPLIRRYIATPAVLLYAVLRARRGGLGDAAAAAGPARGWLVAGVVAALLSVAYLPWHYDMLATVERRLDRDGVLLRRPAARRWRRRRCGPRSQPART